MKRNLPAKVPGRENPRKAKSLVARVCQMSDGEVVRALIRAREGDRWRRKTSEEWGKSFKKTPSFFNPRACKFLLSELVRLHSRGVAIKKYYGFPGYVESYLHPEIGQVAVLGKRNARIRTQYLERKKITPDIRADNLMLLIYSVNSPFCAAIDQRRQREAHEKGWEEQIRFRSMYGWDKAPDQPINVGKFAEAYAKRVGLKDPVGFAHNVEISYKLFNSNFIHDSGGE